MRLSLRWKILLVTQNGLERKGKGGANPLRATSFPKIKTQTKNIHMSNQETIQETLQKMQENVNAFDQVISSMKVTSDKSTKQIQDAVTELKKVNKTAN